MEKGKLTAFDFRIYNRKPESERGLFPTAADLIAYHDWKHSQELAKDLVPTVFDYQQRICTTNYYDPEEVDSLMKLLEHKTAAYVPLGQHSGKGYRLKPSSGILNVTVPTEGSFRTALPHEFLGLVKGVSVRTPKVGGLRNIISIATSPTQEEAKGHRKDSAISITTLGNDDTGFVFFQLGALEYADQAQWARRAGRVPACDLTWTATEDVVVVELNDSGKSGDVYVLCGRQPYDETGALGDLPSDHPNSKPYAGARIAKSFGELGEEFLFK